MQFKQNNHARQWQWKWGKANVAASQDKALMKSYGQAILNYPKKLKLYSPYNKTLHNDLVELNATCMLMIKKYSNQTSYLQPTDTKQKFF